ncbi:hypothetical protein PPNSA23_01600 [Phyllobacterium phragmitis]|uniref:Uncharacterized protein n=1 Tax=Phyllobacterium phragmitis TaxID=2670329 RepID=A0ABQ0GU76_9HYPH
MTSSAWGAKALLSFASMIVCFVVGMDIRFSCSHIAVITLIYEAAIWVKFAHDRDYFGDSGVTVLMGEMSILV